MWYDVFINLITTIICAFIAAVGKRIWLQIKANPVEAQKPKKPNKKLLKKQFFVYLILMSFSLAVGILLPFDTSTPMWGFKPLFLFFSGVSFLAVWGSFEEAMAFYPPDNIVKKPSDDTTDDSGDN